MVRRGTIDFLENTDLNSLPIGRTEIAGNKVFFNVMEAEAKEEDKVNFEIHKKYFFAYRCMCYNRNYKNCFKTRWNSQ